MIKFFKAKDAKIREVANSYKIYNYLTKDDTEQMSVVVGKAVNLHEKTKNTDSDRAYYVLDGEILIDGQLGYKGDVIFIPRNTEYDLKGTFEVVIINSPAFDPNYDTTEVLAGE